MPHAFTLKVQRKINKGWRKESSKLGQEFDIIRNTNTVAINQLYKLIQLKRGPEIEFISSDFTYEIRGDRTKLLIGDQLKGKDTQNSLEQFGADERYTVVGMRPLQPNIAIRTNFLCKVYRPPTLTSLDGYSFTNICNAQILVYDITLNSWSFKDPTTLGLGLGQGGLGSGSLGGESANTNFITSIWMGIQPHGKSSWSSKINLPMGVDSYEFLLNFGLTLGVLIAEGDIVVESSNKYLITRPYYQTDSAFLNQHLASRMKI